MAAILVATFICVQSASAESLETICKEYRYSAASASSDSSYTADTRLKSSFELDYNFLDVEDQLSFGGTFVFGGFVLTGSYGYYTEMPEGLSNYCNWSAGAGLNKRIYLFSFLFLEARAVADYAAYSYTMTGSNTAEAGGSWGCYANARAGLKLFGGTCVTFGYKWRFDEFNFTSDYMTEQMSVGLSFLF